MEIKNVTKIANAYLDSYNKKITTKKAKEILELINFTNNMVMCMPNLEDYMNDLDIGSAIFGYVVNGGYTMPGGRLISDEEIRNAYAEYSYL